MSECKVLLFQLLLHSFQGGWKKENELCRAYVLYYPRKKLESCLSWSNYDQLKNERGQTVDAKNIFSSLKATDWTNNDLMRNNLKTSLRSSVEMEQCWASSREQKVCILLV